MLLRVIGASLAVLLGLSVVEAAKPILGVGKVCGPSSSITAYAIPDEWSCKQVNFIIPGSSLLLPKAKFHKACGGHDSCYDTLGTTQKQCDDTFHSDLRKQCKDAFGKAIFATCKAECFAAARLYYEAVKAGGKKFFKAGQEEAKKKAAEQCVQNKSTGRYCSIFQRRKKTKWYFNPSLGKCLSFRYKGCGGNGNRFGSKAACESACL